tara:strand:- start:1496 stop:3034 length:1539 start_codon:yes stop_codon:yes gene_type:complete
MFDINDFNDDNVWDLICEGRTKGVFQLESNLGRHWAKKVSPRSISELAALLSLIRPGCLKAFKDGKSMTQHYADRKANLDPVVYEHESIEPILKETYGVLVYQEQSMMMAQRLAGFDLKEADGLRKAIGKKKADLMEQVKKSFLEGAEKQGIVNKDIAEEIFSWIEKSNRYAFNKSHAVSYAINAYWSAYCKNYRMLDFYTSYLNRSDRKPKPQIEIKQLVMDAKFEGIEVYPPRLQYMYTNFTDSKDKIYFGLRHIKNVGTKECEKIEDLVSQHDISKYSWMDVLVKVINGCKLNKRAVISLISVGAFNGANNSKHRQEMLYEFDSWKNLSAREQKYIEENYDSKLSLSQNIQMLTENFKITSRRIETVKDIKKSLDSPFYDLSDSAATIADQEFKFLGCSITCSKTDYVMSSQNFMCKDVSKGTIKGKVALAVHINSLREYKTKKGKSPGQLMAFLAVEDSSGELDSVTVFPEAYKEHKDVLIEGNTVLINGEVSKKDKTSIIINKASQI